MFDTLITCKGTKSSAKNKIKMQLFYFFILLFFYSSDFSYLCTRFLETV